MKKLVIALSLLLSICGFWFVNLLNYQKHIKIKEILVEHPENLPTKEFASKTSYGFKNLKADIYRLETIQYIGGNAIGSEYKKYLYKVLDLITELNPYFEHPYKIGLLLLPSYNERYEGLSKEEQNVNIKQAELIGLKGIKNFCDSTKVELIKKEYNLKKIWTEKLYKDPCKSFDIPYYLAFVYYYYLHDPIESSNYYKIASAQSDALGGAKILAAIMQGKGGDREKAFSMFINIGKTLDIKKNKSCSIFASDIEKLGFAVFSEKIKLNKEIFEEITRTRNNIFGEFSEEKEQKVLGENECINYVNKAIRELNLYYIESANEKYKLANSGQNPTNAKELLDKGFIEYLPIDFQQYKDYGIIYVYNEELGHFDYKMGKY